jgi:mannose/fructose/N-acetylgalactosamine-specific phosphotransferase system component IIC
MIVACLLVSHGTWMHVPRIPPVEREAHVLWRRLAVGYLMFALGFAVVLALMWARLNALPTALGGTNPTLLLVIMAGLAVYAAVEAVRTALAIQRRT